MAIFTRWIGSSISTPRNDRMPLCPIGRQRHYGALELAGTGEQVNVNDIVEIADAAVKDEIMDEQPGAKHPRRLGQVLSMWEDTFTGVFKFRARSLVYVSDLPEGALARLEKARRAFADNKGTAHNSSGDRGASAMNGYSPVFKQSHDAGADEVFLTNKREDLDVLSIVKPITLCVDTPAELTVGRGGELGPRLTHVFDASSGDFIPVERTDAILKRARVRHAEAVAHASRLAEEVAAVKSGQAAMQSSGWLLPKRRTSTEGFVMSSRGTRENVVAATSVGDIQLDEASSNGEPSEEEAPESDDSEWENDEQDSDNDSDLSDSTDTGFYQSLDVPVRKSSRRKKSQAEYDRGIQPSSDDVVHTPFSSPLTVPAVTPPARSPPPVVQDTVVKYVGPREKRPRRLAMPPVKESALSLRHEEEPLSSSHSTATSRSIQVRTRGRANESSLPIQPLLHSSAEAMGDAVGAAESKPRPSIAGKRKRGRPAKITEDGAGEFEYATQQILVGDSYQADIPNLLSVKDREKEDVPQTAGTSAKMVWRSIRNWDPQSRGMLSSYLRAAKEVVQTKQAAPGVAVHVRLGGGQDQRDDGVNTASIASSYAVWAVTAGRNSSGVIRVACSEMAQTEVPISAIQIVQSEEEALAALVDARCTLDDFQPALKALNEASPESVDLWTIPQVITLERALQNGFDPERQLHGWAPEGIKLDREDYTDLANVGQQVPGKTPAQVLFFYYRYLAAAAPLTDIVYGKKAAEARKLENVLHAGGTDQLERTNTVRLRLTSAAKQSRADPGATCPAAHNSSVVCCDPQTKPKSSIPEAVGPSAPMTDIFLSEKGSLSPDEHTRSLAAVGAVPVSSCGPIVAAHGATANTFHREYEHQHAAKDYGKASRNQPADVEVLKVTNSYDASRRNGTTPGSNLTAVSVSTVAHTRQHSTEARSRQIRPLLVAAGPTGLALYGHHTEVAVAMRSGDSPQPRSVLQNGVQFGRERVSGDDRSRGYVANQGGVRNGGYYGYNNWSKAGMGEDDECGFMSPCWRLLERASSFMDQDQLVYMRGLIVTHVRKPMSRDQLLERAESCLQEQPKIFAAFVKMFDGLNHIRADSDLVPLYFTTKRALSDTPSESIPMSKVPFSGKVPPTAGRTDSRTRASYSSYPHPPIVDRTFTPPTRPTNNRGDLTDHDHYHGYDYGRGGAGAPLEATSNSYSHIAAARADARLHWSIPADGSSRSGWWRHDASERTPTHMSGTAGALSVPNSAGPTGRSVMMYPEHERERGFDARGEAMRAWPYHHSRQRPGQWRPGGGVSHFPAAGVPIESKAARPKLS